MMEQINWNKYFDNIYIISRCLYIDRRKKLEKELQRINLTNYNYWYNCDNQLIDYNRYEINNLTIPQIRCTFAHYTLIKTLYELNYDNVLIMEDDIAFLKDINEVNNQLEIFFENKQQNNYYLFDYIYFSSNYYNASMYYLDRKGMEYLIYCIENYPLINDNFAYDNNIQNFIKTNNNGYVIYNVANGNKIDIFLKNDILPNIKISPIRIAIQNQYDLDHSSYIDYNNEIDFEKYNIT